jgi:hypothetical protein
MNLDGIFLIGFIDLTIKDRFKKNRGCMQMGFPACLNVKTPYPTRGNINQGSVSVLVEKLCQCE